MIQYKLLVCGKLQVHDDFKRYSFSLTNDEFLSLMVSLEVGSYAKQTKSIISQDKRTKFSQSSSYRWRLSLPHQITSEVLEVAGIKALGGQNQYFRSYSIIPLNSKASSYMIGGNIQELQDMFTSRQASPFNLIYLLNGNLFSLLNVRFLYRQLTDPYSLINNQVGHTEKQKRDNSFSRRSRNRSELFIRSTTLEHSILRQN